MADTVRDEQAPPDPEEARSATRAERRRAERAQSRRAGRRLRKPLPFWQELPILLLLAVVLALLIKTYLVQAFYIPSESMQNTLLVSDRVLVNKLVYHFRQPHRGEIVVFNGVDSWAPEVRYAPPSNVVERLGRAVGGALGMAPSGEKDYIKRVIGLPGDTVQCCDAQGRVTVDGRALDEPYVFDNNPAEARSFGPIKVPAGRLWVMGDHRGVSADSRAHVEDRWHGTIPEDHVVGRAFVIVWPPGRAAVLRVPATFQHQTANAVAAVLPAVPVTVAPGLLVAVRVAARRAGRVRR